MYSRFDACSLSREMGYETWKRDMDGRLHDILYIRESSDLKIFSGKKIELASENIVIFKKKDK